MKLAKFLGILSICIFMFSCRSVTTEYSRTKVEKIEKIALISTMIGAVSFPDQRLSSLSSVINPSLSEMIYHDDVKRQYSDTIIKLSEKNSKYIRKIVADNLAFKFKCKVLYGTELQTYPGYDYLLKNMNFSEALKTEDKYFSRIVTAYGDANPFNFEKGFVRNYFADEKKVLNRISEVSKHIEADVFAVTYSRIIVENVRVLGTGANLHLETVLYLISRDGNKLLEAQSDSKMTYAPFKDIYQYEYQLQQIEQVMDKMMQAVDLDKIIGENKEYF